MIYFITICGFLGAWLLFAGPVYQAALELQEQEVDREQLDAAAKGVAPPPGFSRWWWLLPPVAYLKQKRRADAHRQAIMRSLSPDAMKQTIAFFDKATGWMIVSAGALLLAVKETWELVELFEWPAFVFWILVVVIVALCIGYAVTRTRRSNRALQPAEGGEG